ncbi:MAG: 50S ribosomal protein L18 [Proteobacteria bacterium]|jgi:large subunit ribosomal protein L18|nr:50S ribosomal protein L18 [Pseudomonadota bacterium]MDA0941741.1 50S ribosomal protein L18 [Pseudomonadota bacterium]
MVNKEQSRIRRSRKTRAKIAELGRTRLTVFRSNLNIYAQVIDAATNKVVATASTVEAEMRKKLKKTGDVSAAAEIGKRIAEKAKKAGVEEVAFDRSGYRYHGRIKALAEAARENGLKF